MNQGALDFNFVCSLVLLSCLLLFSSTINFHIKFFSRRYLLVNFSKLLQVVFQEGNLLFLGDIPAAVIRLHPCTLSTQQWGRFFFSHKCRWESARPGVVDGAAYFSDTEGEILNEKLAKVVEGVELTGLRHQQRGGLGVCTAHLRHLRRDRGIRRLREHQTERKTANITLPRFPPAL